MNVVRISRTNEASQDDDDSRQLAAYGPSENEIRIVGDLPKAKPPQIVAK
jgi:hypothetical protein